MSYILSLREWQNRTSAWHESAWGNPGTERMGLKLAEEVGEVCEALVKVGQGHPKAPQLDLGAELADVFIVLTILASEAGLDLQSCVENKFERLPR